MKRIYVLIIVLLCLFGISRISAQAARVCKLTDMHYRLVFRTNNNETSSFLKFLDHDGVTYKTTFPGLIESPQWLGRNELVFQMWTDHRSDIWKFSLNTRHVTQLTHSDLDAQNPVVMDNGEIWYFENIDGTPLLDSVKADGSDQTVLQTLPLGRFYYLSPDGTLAILSDNPTNIIVTKDKKTLAEGYQFLGYISQIALSPDGKQLALIREDESGTKGALVIIPIPNKDNSTFIAPTLPFSPTILSWSLDSSKLLISGEGEQDGKTTTEILFWNQVDTTLTGIRLYFHVTEAALSPNGKSLAVVVKDGDQPEGTVMIYDLATQREPCLLGPGSDLSWDPVSNENIPT